MAKSSLTMKIGLNDEATAQLNRIEKLLERQQQLPNVSAASLGGIVAAACVAVGVSSRKVSRRSLLGIGLFWRFRGDV